MFFVFTWILVSATLDRCSNDSDRCERLKGDLMDDSTGKREVDFAIYSARRTNFTDIQCKSEVCLNTECCKFKTFLNQKYQKSYGAVSLLVMLLELGLENDILNLPSFTAINAAVRRKEALLHEELAVWGPLFPFSSRENLTEEEREAQRNGFNIGSWPLAVARSASIHGLLLTKVVLPNSIIGRSFAFPFGWHSLFQGKIEIGPLPNLQELKESEMMMILARRPIESLKNLNIREKLNDIVTPHWVLGRNDGSIFSSGNIGRDGGNYLDYEQFSRDWESLGVGMIFESHNLVETLDINELVSEARDRVMKNPNLEILGATHADFIRDQLTRDKNPTLEMWTGLNQSLNVAVEMSLKYDKTL